MTYIHNITRSLVHRVIGLGQTFGSEAGSVGEGFMYLVIVCSLVFMTGFAFHSDNPDLWIQAKKTQVMTVLHLNQQNSQAIKDQWIAYNQSHQENAPIRYANTR